MGSWFPPPGASDHEWPLKWVVLSSISLVPNKMVTRNSKVLDERKISYQQARHVYGKNNLYGTNNFKKGMGYAVVHMIVNMEGYDTTETFSG